MTRKENGQRYPPGVRPMKTNESQNELYETCSMAAGGDYDSTIKIEKGSTRRQTIVSAHRQLMCFLRKVDLEGEQIHLQGDDREHLGGEPIRVAPHPQLGVGHRGPPGRQPGAAGIGGGVHRQAVQGSFQEGRGRVGEKRESRKAS